MCDGTNGRSSIVRNGVCHVRVTCLTKHASTKAQSKNFKIPLYVAVIRAIIDSSACLCSGVRRCMVRNHKDCQHTRRKLIELSGHDACHEVMSSLFELEDGFKEIEMSPTRTDGQDRNEVTTENNDGDNDSENSEDGGNDHDDLWVRFKATTFSRIQDQLDSFLEASSFCLVEPVYLGFFPYQTQ